MITNYFTLLALSNELQSALHGSPIYEVYSQDKNQLWIVPRAESGGLRRSSGSSLCICIDPKFNYCFLSNKHTRAKKNSVNLFQDIGEIVVTTVSIISYERILRLDFSNNMTLLIKLYNTSESNVLLVNTDNVIIEAFKQNKTLHGTKYSFETTRSDPRKVFEKEAFERSFTADSSKCTLIALKHTLPILGQYLVREVLYRAGIDEKAKISQLTNEETQKIFHHVQHSFITTENTTSRIYTLRNNTKVFSIFQLSHLTDCTYETFQSVNDGIRAFVRKEVSINKVESDKRQLESKLTSEMRRLQRSLEQMARELSNEDRGGYYEHMGKLLMANAHCVTKGLSEVTLSDIDDDASLVRIVIEPHLTPVQNAARYFDKAKKNRVAHAEIQRRRDRMRTKLPLIEKLLEELSRCDSNEQVREFRTSNEKALSSLKLSRPDEETELPPFRIFTVIGGFEVWVGKNSANNDLLTMKYAKLNDLWFHARGASGSHAVLRVHGSAAPTKDAIYQTASIAAYYSKMRNAGNVPVAYCERKFVRKPKGSHAGTVVLEREKVIFVQPRLPQI